jgi:hypothetical protein
MVSMGKKKLPDNVKLFWTFDEHDLVVTVDDGDVVTKSQYSLRKERGHDVIALSEDGKKEPNRFGWYEVKDGQLQIQVTLDTGKPPERWNEGEVMLLRPAPKPAGAVERRGPVPRQSSPYDVHQSAGTSPPSRLPQKTTA